jgi:hypothetical protein
VPTYTLFGTRFLPSVRYSFSETTKAFIGYRLNSLASLRYDLYKLRAKGLVHKLPRSRRYQLTPHGYSLCLVFLKLFERVYAPLTASLLRPVPGDRKLQQQRQSQLDRLYQRVVDDLDQLLSAVGLKLAA